MIKLLIFDLDGTLVDTIQDITDAVNYALAPFSANAYSVEETKVMVGSGISSLLNSLIPPGKNSHTAGQETISRFLDFYSRHLLDNTRLYPHVPETLSSLSVYKKAVLSNKRELYSREILEKLNISQYFDSIWGSDSVREKKPSAVPVLDLLDKFGASRENAVIIGDSNFDIEAGKAAGIKTIGVTYGFRTRDNLKDADIIIDRFDDLLKVIPGI